MPQTQTYSKPLVESASAPQGKPILEPYSPPNLPLKGGWTLKQKVALGLGITVVAGVGLGLAWRAYRNYETNKAEAKSLTEGTPETFAKELHMAFDNDGWPGTNMGEFRDIVGRIKSQEEWIRIEGKYYTMYHKALAARIESELQTSEIKEFLAIKSAMPLKAGQKLVGDAQYRSWAMRLKAAFDKVYGFIPGTDEMAIKTVFLEIPTQRSFINVGKAYAKEYKGANILTDLKSELEIWEYDDYMKIILNKPKS